MPSANGRRLSAEVGVSPVSFHHQQNHLSLPFSPSSSAVLSHLHKSVPSNDNKTNKCKPSATKNRKRTKCGSKASLQLSPITKQQQNGTRGVKFGGKKPHQVARRNERERKRVQQLNSEFETLAGKLSVSCKAFFDKKLTKAQTLKAAILYIRHLERVLSSERGTNGAGTAEEEFRRQCLAMAAINAKETEDEEMLLEEIEEEEEEADQPRAEGIISDQCVSLSPSAHPPFACSADQLLSSFSYASSPSIIYHRPICAPPPPPAPLSSISPLFSPSPSSVPFHSPQIFQTVHYLDKPQQQF